MSGSGIYMIVHVPSRKFYIGSAHDFGRRSRLHRRQLLAGDHHSILLQRAWDKYGADEFRFLILETVERGEDFKARLLAAEQRWLDSADTAYNICAVAGSSLGRRWTLEERARRAANSVPVSAETRAKLSAAGKGRVFSEETRAKMRVPNPAKGRSRPMSESTKALLAAANAKPHPWTAARNRAQKGIPTGKPSGHSGKRWGTSPRTLSRHRREQRLAAQ